jgi:hypothetical protein
VAQFVWSIVFLGLFTAALLIFRPFVDVYKNVGLIVVLATSMLSAVSNLLLSDVAHVPAAALALSYVVVAVCIGFMAVSVLGFSGYWVYKKLYVADVGFRTWC